MALLEQKNVREMEVWNGSKGFQKGQFQMQDRSVLV